MSVENVLAEVKRDPAGFRSRTIDTLVRTAVFEGDTGKRDEARHAIRKAAAVLGILRQPPLTVAPGTIAAARNLLYCINRHQGIFYARHPI